VDGDDRETDIGNREHPVGNDFFQMHFIAALWKLHGNAPEPV
jgi:hypothetical protein